MNNQTVAILSAPLQGYTEKFFRDAHRESIGGIEEYYTPFLRLEKGEVRNRDRRDAASENNQPQMQTVPQVLVKSGEEAGILFPMLAEWGYRRIDLNFGCPFPKVMNQEYGAGILSCPDRIRRIFSVAADFPHIEFSVKMRSGTKSPEDALKLLPLLNHVPLKHIVLHPRTGIMQYKGTPNRELFFRFQAECAHTVYYNGDIMTPEDASGFSHLMIGRGLLADPFLAQKIRRSEILSPEEQTEKLRLFHQRLMVSLNDNEQILEKMKLLWEYFLPDGDRRLRKKIQKARTLEEYQLAAEELIARY